MKKVPWYVKVANRLTIVLLRWGVKLVGLGGYPMHLLTVVGRKSGKPRTVPIVTLGQNGRNYLASPFGEVDWVHNLRAAGQATLTRAGRTRPTRAVELDNEEAGAVLHEECRRRNPFLSKFGVRPDSSLADCRQACREHPIFWLQDA